MVEAADQLEGSNPTKAGNEEERVVYPTCGEIFDESGYKFIVHAFTTQQSAPTFVEGRGRPDLGEGEIPQEKLHEKEVSDVQDATTQEPTSLNILVEIPTNPRREELEDEVIPNFMDEDCTVTLEPFHDIENNRNGTRRTKK